MIGAGLGGWVAHEAVLVRKRGGSDNSTIEVGEMLETFGKD